MDRFKIVEIKGRFGNEFYIKENITKKRLFGKEKPLLVDLYFPMYHNYVNDIWKIQDFKWNCGSLRHAKEMIDFYLEWETKEDFIYRDYTFKPIMYKGQNNFKCITYYLPSSYYKDGPHNSGWLTFKDEREMRVYVDEQLDTGKVIEVHNV